MSQMLTKDTQPQRQKLNFTTTSLRNVVISNTSDVIFYEVVTPKWEPHLTKISRLEPNSREFNLIGELHWQSPNEDRRDAGKGKENANEGANENAGSESVAIARKNIKEKGARPVKMRLYGGAIKPTKEFLKENQGTGATSEL